MFGKNNHRVSPRWRALPLRNEHPTPSKKPTYALAFNAPIGFTADAIVWDAIAVAGEITLVWQKFRQAVSIFTFRVILIFALIFLISGLNDAPDAAVADLNVTQSQPKIESIKVTGQVKAATATKGPVITWPVSRGYITTTFTYWHPGIDIPKPYGTFVRPYTAGEVTFAGWDGGFGLTVVVKHTNGYTSRYAHLASINTHRGEKVSTRSIIGTVGATGFAFGSHLHFEVYKDGLAINPLLVIH